MKVIPEALVEHVKRIDRVVEVAESWSTLEQASGFLAWLVFLLIHEGGFDELTLEAMIANAKEYVEGEMYDVEKLSN